MTVLQLVERERLQLRRLHLATVGAFVIAFTGGLLALGALVFGATRWLHLPRSLPFFLWALIVVGDVVVIAWAVRWLERRVSKGGVAAAIEREQSLRSGALLGAIEVAETGALGRRAADRLTAHLEGVGPHLLPVAQRTSSRRMWKVGATAVVALGLLGAAAPTFGDGLRAVLRPDRAWRGSLLPPLEFRSLPPTVMQGERFKIWVVATGRQSVTLLDRAPGESWQSQTIAVSPRTGVASTTLGPMRGDLHMVVSDGRSSTDTVVIHVTDRPFVGAVTMRATYPAYLDRPVEGLPIGEPARVPYGTIIDVSGHASTDLHGVYLVSGHDSVAFGVSGLAFSGQFEAKRSGTWQWVAQGDAGAIPDVPLPLELEVIPDSVPNVAITSPSIDTIVASTDRITLNINATDDHGLVRVELQSWRTGADGSRHTVLTQQLASPRDALWSGSVDLDLASRGLEPGDALSVKAVATDNSPWAQRGESRELMLKIPTTDERREMARELGDSTVATAQAMAKSEQALQARTDAMARERGTRDPSADAASGSSSSSSSGSSGDLGYESAEKTRELAKDQRALTDQVKQLQQNAKALEDQLRQAGALDSSLAHQLQEAQALLKDALTPELLAQMQKLEKSAQQLSRSDAQASLKDLQAMQQQLRDQLEKSAELLKRAALEGSMQTLGDEAKELASRDKQLADSLAGSSRPQTKQADARQLADQTDHLDGAIKKLEDRLNQDQATEGATHAAAAEQHAAASEEELRAAAKDSASSQPAAPRSPGQQGATGAMEQDARSAAAQMQSAAQSMQQARDDQVQSWKQELSTTLDQSIQEMLQMSRQETSLEQQVRSGQANQQDVRGEQSAIKQGLDDVAKRLETEGQESSLLSNRSQKAVSDAEQKAQQAVQASSSTSPSSGPTAGAMEDAAQSLNRAAASLARDREHVNTATSATGFAEMMQQLQEMANKQGAINSQAQNLLSMPGAMQTSAAQAAARELARQQRQLAQQLEELGDVPGGDQAAKLAQQAKQVADALDNGQLNPETLARQEQLFHKMLDAGRTLQADDREDGQHRQATAAKGDEHFAPTNTNSSGAAASRFRAPTWDELRGLTADERRAILDYFQKINGHGP